MDTADAILADIFAVEEDGEGAAPHQPAIISELGQAMANSDAQLLDGHAHARWQGS